MRKINKALLLVLVIAPCFLSAQVITKTFTKNVPINLLPIRIENKKYLISKFQMDLKVIN